MRERPILFSGPMVRALLDGTKTQTRRAVTLTDSGRVKAVGSRINWHLDDPDAVKACPYGKPGDRLWVRETWFTPIGWDTVKPIDLPSPDGSGATPQIQYRADFGESCTAGRLRPAIFMRRWMSRITLELTAVRCERLNDISEADAQAEGIVRQTFRPAPGVDGEPDIVAFSALPSDAYPKCKVSAREAYRRLWEQINGSGSWAANPWVWVIEFRNL